MMAQTALPVGITIHFVGANKPPPLLRHPDKLILRWILGKIPLFPQRAIDLSLCSATGVSTWPIDRAILPSVCPTGIEPDDVLRETFRLPVEAARVKAREIISQTTPQGDHMTIVEQWRQLPDGHIELTMRRLRTSN